MIGRAAKARRVDDIATGDQFILRVGASGVSFQVNGEGERMPVPGGFDALSARPEQWAGDGPASAAQTRGHSLWTSFFTGFAAIALQDAAEAAAAAGMGLTLRVVPELQTPADLWWASWELLCDATGGGFLALRPGLSIVRGTEHDRAPRPSPNGDAVRVLAISLAYLDGAPAAWRSAFASCERELELLRNEAARSAGRVVVDERIDLDMVTFLDLLTTTDAHIVHIIGTASGSGDLVVHDPGAGALWGDAQSNADTWAGPADSHRVDANAIADALLDNTDVTLVVLNGCDFERMAEHVADQTGVAVVAHRGGVLDPHTVALTENFYPALFAGQALDVAIASAKQHLERSFPGQAGWASIITFTGWPAPRFGAGSLADYPGVIQLEDTSGGDSGWTGSADDLLRQIHERNLGRLQTLDAKVSWAPIADQVSRATAGMSAR